MTDDRTLGYLEASVEALKTGQEQLNVRMEAGFARMEAGFNEISARFAETNARIDETNARIDRLLYVVLAIGGGIIAHLTRKWLEANRRRLSSSKMRPRGIHFAGGAPGQPAARRSSPWPPNVPSWPELLPGAYWMWTWSASAPPFGGIVHPDSQD